MVIKASQFIPSAYHGAWRSMRAWEYDEYAFEGGRGSAKTTVAANRAVDVLMRGTDGNFVCYKKHKTEIEASVYSEIYKVIERRNWCDLFRFKISPFEITRRDTAQKIFFQGLDDPGKSKGITARRGYIQGVWFEEADQFSSMKEIDTVLQTLGRGGEHFHVIYTYNPPESNAHWINVEMSQPNPHRLKLHTTYRDVPESWLGPFFFHRMEAIRAQSETRYQHEYEGIPTGTGHEIFTNIRLVHYTAKEIDEMRRKRWGMDFGQGHPTTLVGTNYIPKLVDGKDIGGRLQIFDAWGKSNARNREVYEELERRQLLDTLITADPGGGGKGVIGELRDMGARRIIQAYKPGGSVERGVNWMRDLEAIEIHDELEWCIRQFKLYLWLTMKDGTNRNELPDINDDFIDATRYSRQDEIFAHYGSRLAIDV